MIRGFTSLITIVMIQLKYSNALIFKKICLNFNHDLIPKSNQMKNSLDTNYRFRKVKDLDISIHFYKFGF